MNAELARKIEELKAKRGAIILAHNYQLPGVQDIADFSGDSLELSRRAAQVDEGVIVFCGVHFMAETASILSPEKTVLIPDREAGCPMADMVTAEGLRALKAKHPHAKVVCYVNSTAEVKAESDICCTSSNAAAVVESIPAGEEIIFVPDQYLGEHTAEQTGRDLILWHGYCTTHVRILESDLARLKQEYPEAVTMVHPECTGPVREAADEVLSTGGMCRFARESDATEFIVGTEIGLLHRLQKENPEKTFHAASQRGICPNMKKITVEKVLWSLQDMKHRVTVHEHVRSRALQAIEKMLEL